MSSSMRFFDRPTPSRARIALGGSSQRASSSTELLSRARAQREARARERARISAACTLQVALRARAAHRRVRAQIAARILAHASADEGNVPAVALVVASCRGAVSCEGGSVSERQMLKLGPDSVVRAVLAAQCVKIPGTELGVVRAKLAVVFVAEAWRLAKRRRLMRSRDAQRKIQRAENGKRLDASHGANEESRAGTEDTEAVDLARQCLQASVGLLRGLENCSMAERAVVADVTTQWSLFRLISRMVRAGMHSLHPRIEAAMMDVTISALLIGYSTVSDDSSQDRPALETLVMDASLVRFVCELFTVKGVSEILIRRIKTSTVVDSLLRIPEHVLDVLSSYVGDPESGLSGLPDIHVLYLLENVLHMNNVLSKKQDSSWQWRVVSVVAAFIKQLSESVLRFRDDSDDEDDSRHQAVVFSHERTDVEVSKSQGLNEYALRGEGNLRDAFDDGIGEEGYDLESVDESWVVSGTGSNDLEAVERGTFARLINDMSHLVSDETVRILFSRAMREGRAATVRMCKLFGVLTRVEQRLQLAFQSALAFWRPARSSSIVGASDHILPYMWQQCQAPDLTLTLDLSEGRAAVLLVFTRAYSHFLCVQDEDEMFESERPFTKQQVRDVSQTLKRVLFTSLYARPSSVSWLDGTDALSLSMQNASIIRDDPDILDGVAQLLGRLYVCDSRHEFRTSDDFWIAGGGQLASDTFVMDAVAAGPTALTIAPGTSREGLGTFGNSPVVSASRRRTLMSGATDLLQVAPYMAPFSSRAKIFHTWVGVERERYGRGAFAMQRSRWITVRRDYLFEDAFDHLNFLGDDLKRPVRVKFVDEHGIEEAGIDGGGVYKEFMYEVVRRAFSPSLYGLFCETPDGHLYPNPDAHLVDDLYMQRFEFVGRLLGKALFDGVLVDIPMASFFLSKLLLKPNYPSDLRSFDPELYKNLMFLRKCDAETVESLGLTFTVANTGYGQMKEVELVRDGSAISVTAQNRIEYMHRVSHYRMNSQIRAQCDAFIRGFSEVIQPEYIRLFSERELQMLISGSTSSLDLADLRRNTNYSGGYTEDTDVIRWLWEVLSELSAEQQSQLLQFVTSSPRAPLLGFAYLNPSFCVHKAGESERLPTASTCMNLLKLPQYKSIDVLRAKLLYSIESNSGFDLS